MQPSEQKHKSQKTARDLKKEYNQDNIPEADELIAPQRSQDIYLRTENTREIKPLPLEKLSGCDNPYSCDVAVTEKRRKSLDTEKQLRSHQINTPKTETFARQRSGSIQPAVISVSSQTYLRSQNCCRKAKYQPHHHPQSRQPVTANIKRLQPQEEEVETELISENISNDSDQNEDQCESLDKAEFDSLPRYDSRVSYSSKRTSSNPFVLARGTSFSVSSKGGVPKFRRQSTLSQWSQRRASILKMRKGASSGDGGGGGAYSHVMPALLPDSPSKTVGYTPRGEL